MTNRLTLRLGNELDEIPAVDARLGFRAAYVLEMLDTRREETVQSFVFPLNPKQYNLSEPFAVTLTPTEGDTVVAEENGQIIREITLEGTFGWEKKAAPVFVTSSSERTASRGEVNRSQGVSGNEHFLALRRFFRRYSDLKKDPSRAGSIRLIFHSLKDDDHFVVVPRSFETPRDARSTRVTYEYRITMAVIGNSDRRIVPEGTPGGLDDPLKMIAEALNDARAYFANINADLGKIKRKVGNIQAVMINASALINSVSNVLTGATSLIEFTFNQATNIVEGVADAGDTLADAIIDASIGQIEFQVINFIRLERAFNRILAFPDKFQDAADDFQRTFNWYTGARRLTRDDIRNGTAGAQPGTALEVARGSVGENGLNLDDYDGLQKVEVRRTDSLVSIANRYRTTPETIILINDLRYPYISEGGGPGVRSAGEEILVPILAGGQSAATAPQGGYLTEDEALYGRDIALDLDVFEREKRLEWRVDLSRDLDDAQTVTGVDNVVQGIRLIVEQERGTNAYIPELGIKRTPGQKGTIQRMILASLNLREAILLDPRIESIATMLVALDGDVLTQEITPVIRGQREGTTLVVPFGRASGASRG